jgi:hypothetical protein
MLYKGGGLGEKWETGQGKGNQMRGSLGPSPGLAPPLGSPSPFCPPPPPPLSFYMGGLSWTDL